MMGHGIGHCDECYLVLMADDDRAVPYGGTVPELRLRRLLHRWSVRLYTPELRQMLERR